MTTQKIDPLEVIENIPPIDPDSEIPENDGTWVRPQLVPKIVTTADKRIAIENLIA